MGKSRNLFSVLQFGNQSDLLKEELNIWNKNYLDVNSLVTDKFIMQKSLDKAKTDLESLRQKYQELELKHRKMLTEFSASQAKCDCYEGRWVEGASSETSDQDSGKHSDTSLVNSSEECWAEIDKINKSFHKRGGKCGETGQAGQSSPRKMAVVKPSSHQPGPDRERDR